MVDIDLDKIDFSELPITREGLEEWLEENGDVVESARELWLDLDVQVVSTVENPAHRSEVVAMKNEDTERARAEEVPLLTYKEEKDSEQEEGLIYAPAMVPDEPDKEGDVVPTPVVEKAAHDYMRNLRNEEVDADHETPIQMDEAINSRGTVVESWLLKEEKQFETAEGDTQTYQEGTWMMGIDAEKEVYERFKAGELSGLSIMGTPSVVKSEESQTLIQADEETDIMTESESENTVSVQIEKDELAENIADTVAESIELPEPEPEVEIKEPETLEELETATKAIDPDEVDLRNLDALIADLMPDGINASDVTEALAPLRDEFSDSEEESVEEDAEEVEETEEEDTEVEPEATEESEEPEETEEKDTEAEDTEDAEKDAEDTEEEKEIEREVTEKNQDSEEKETGQSRYASMWEEFN